MAPSLISARTLERHLDWIGAVRLITLDELAAWLEGARQLTSRWWQLPSMMDIATCTTMPSQP